MNITKIEKIVKNSFSLSPNGAVCKFIALDKKWGLKLFTNPRKRDETYENQKKCFQVDLAPEVGDCIDLPSGPMRFGYITEIVEIPFNPNDYDPDAEYDEKDDPYQEIWEWEEANYSEIQDLKRELRRKAGFDFFDAHGFNFGYKDGKLIPIDFGIDDAWETRENFEEIEAELLQLDYTDEID